MNEDDYGDDALDRQRIREFYGKFAVLMSLIPNLTQPYRKLSILQDAIEYIKELEGSVNELKLLLEDSKIKESSDGTKSTCQLCNKYGHLASHCDLRFDKNFNNPNAIRVASPETVNNSELLADSGATNHVRTRLQGS